MRMGVRLTPSPPPKKKTLKKPSLITLIQYFRYKIGLTGVLSLLEIHCNIKVEQNRKKDSQGQMFLSHEKNILLWRLNCLFWNKNFYFKKLKQIYK